MMKISRIVIVTAVCLLLTTAGPAQAVDVEKEVLFTRAIIQANRTQIVLNTLGLSEEQIEAFSPVYLDYWEEMNQENTRLADLILDYAANFEDLSDDKALSMLDKYLDIQKRKIAIKKKHVKKFKKVLTPKKLVQLYQIENKMDAIIMMELAAEVPLVR
jgi:hypothetical protein